MQNGTDSEIGNTTERIIIGCTYFVLAMIFLVIYSGCTYVIATNKRIGSPSYYAIILQMAYTDIVQLVFVGAVPALFLLWPTVANIHWINKLCGAIANSSWFLYCASANLLAFNRFVHIVWHTKVDTIFSKNRTRLYICLLYGYSACWFVALSTVDLDFYFYINIYSFYYCDTQKGYIASQIDMITDFTNVICMAAWYSMICVKIRSEIRSMQSNILVAQERKHEVKILFQAFLLCALFSIEFLIFFFFPFITTNRWSYVVDTLLWIVLAGLNSIIYLALNSIIRQGFLELYGCKKPKRHNELCAIDLKTRPSMTKRSSKVIPIVD